MSEFWVEKGEMQPNFLMRTEAHHSDASAWTSVGAIMAPFSSTISAHEQICLLQGSGQHCAALLITYLTL